MKITYIKTAGFRKVENEFETEAGKTERPEPQRRRYHL